MSTERISCDFDWGTGGIVDRKNSARFIVETVEIDSVMFGRNIDPPSFLYAFLLTVAFSLFVNGVMYLS